ncbi:formylglycine-generating enzyme family protein [Microcoleus sp. herbarium13]|uniref:formylglycine-generating enzyme family protein n=1 Tax=unclassified Microcoleus TaxID=2642155 RepID=UPI003FA5A492
MICCINPNCRNPENPDGQTYCITCGIKLVQTPARKPTPASSTRRNFIRRASSSIVAVSIYGGLNQYISSCSSTSKAASEASPKNSSKPKSSTNFKTFDFETVTVDVRGKITNRQRHQAQFISEDLGSDVILDMVAIPGGSFVMGSPDTEAERFDNEGPQRTVNIPPFFMGKYEVTQAQYQAVMGNNPAFFKGAKRPVELISWDEAVKFCQKLSQKTSKTCRLPSEAEWEYACRAGTTTPFYFGETITPDLVNYDGNVSYGAAPKGLYREQTTDVGSFPPNAFGLYDMHGNVWEWCADPWHDNHEGAPSDGRVWDGSSNYNRYQTYDLLVNIKNDYRTRLLRGGSWNFDPAHCRSAIRDFSNAPDHANEYIGFRVVSVAA